MDKKEALEKARKLELARLSWDESTGIWREVRIPAGESRDAVTAARRLRDRRAVRALVLLGYDGFEADFFFYEHGDLSGTLAEVVDGYMKEEER